MTRAGARLWTERTVIKAYVPDPFALWTAATTRLLAQARLAGHVNEGIRPAHTARTLVPAFFGLCTLTEAIEGTTVLDGRLTDWWHLTLRGFVGDCDVLARVEAASPGPALGDGL
ncbi:A-factor receptor protein [Streptomyces sp. V17-9]|nr:A-factor receptor protein [Streptomyces sp. V17-9]